MSLIRTVGKLKETVTVEWQIDSFFSVINDDALDSSTFSFADNNWRLRLNARDTHDFMKLQLIKVAGDRDLTDVECTAGLKKINGVVEHYAFIISVAEFSEGVLIRRNPLYRRRTLLHRGTLIISCTLSRSISHEQTPLKLIKLDSLSNDFKSILTNKTGCDVILKVRGKEFHVHKSVLMARSPVFSAMFQNDWLESQSGVVIIPDCDADSFQEFLEYLYCGKLENTSFLTVLNLYRTSDKYDVQDFKTYCVDYIKRYITPDNVCDVLTLADLHNEEELLSIAQDFFNEHADEVVVTSHWENLIRSNYRLANLCIKDLIRAPNI